jgi:tetratricopeptide (TPR) repeat protein
MRRLSIVLVLALVPAAWPQVEGVGISLISVATESEAESVRELAITGPRSFASLAREYSLDSSASDGGYLGALRVSDLRGEFRAALEGLRPGEVSRITPLGNGFLLLRPDTSEEEEWRRANDAGLVALAEGRDGDAAAALERAVELAEGMADDRLPTSLHNLAVVHARSENYAAALPLSERALLVLERVFGPRHQEVAAARDSLATMHELAGDYARAAELYAGALEIATEALGPDHPNVGATLNNLAGLRQREGKYAEAQSLYSQALGIFERTLGPGHPSALGVALDLSQFPTHPEFSCTPDMAFCNDAVPAGLDAVMRYGRGTAWADIDGDLWDDLFLADADNRWDTAGYGVSMFFLNQQDGTFAARTATGLGIDEADLVSTWNGSFADFDNDGDADLLLANGGYSGLSNLAFYENRIREEGVFVDITGPSGIGIANSAPARWWGTSWADYDNDGWLDVVVTRTEGVALLFHNNGDGTFGDAGSSVGVGIPMRDGKNPVWIDYDNDGDPDLYLAGMWEHVFYRNDGGRFTDVTGTIFPDPFPYPDLWPFSPDRTEDPFAFAAAASDFDQDGFEDLYIGRWDIQDVLLLNDGAGRFRVHGTDRGIVAYADVTTDWFAEAPMASSSTAHLQFENTMGLGVGDLFDDGFPDVVIGSGSPSRTGGVVIFCNSGDLFSRCTDEVMTGADRTWRTRGHGAAFADFDHDGDTDLAVNLGGHPDYDVDVGRVSPEWPVLYVNKQGASGRTASVTLVGTRSNRDALGARLRVSGENVRHYTVRSMQGFQSQNSRTQTLSLGSATSAGLEIRWPSGQVQSVRIEAGDRVILTEP